MHWPAHIGPAARSERAGPLAAKPIPAWCHHEAPFLREAGRSVGRGDRGPVPG